MGYETTLIIVTGNEPNGFQAIEATLQMGKIANDSIGDLITSLTKDAKEKAKKYKLFETLEELKKGIKFLFTPEGDYNEDIKKLPKSERDILYQKQLGIPRETLEKKFPYIYYGSGDSEEFVDKYSTPLLVTDVETILEAIKRDNAKSIHTKEYDSPDGYRRFVTAITLLESFRKKNDMYTNVKVILYGH